MSETPHPTDIEVARALNAVVTTMNDQGMARADQGRLRQIVTGALGGEERVLVAVGVGEEDVARLTDREHRVLARVFWQPADRSSGTRADRGRRRADGRWVGERVGAPLSGGYVPS
jgi:hypothetical protein